MLGQAEWMDMYTDRRGLVKLVNINLWAKKSEFEDKPNFKYPPFSSREKNRPFPGLTQ